MLSNYMEKRVERRLRDNLHIKGAVLGTFEDQTLSRALQENHEARFKVRRCDSTFFCLNLAFGKLYSYKLSRVI